MLYNAHNGRVTVYGANMNYVSFGRGELTLVILPGLSDGLQNVRGKALLLERPYRAYLDRFTVYIFSRRDGLAVGASICDMARDQAEALRALGIRRACVMGVSQGGMIAQSLAVEHPDLVEKLVLAVTAPRVNPIIHDCVSHWIDFAKRGDHRQLMIDTAEKHYSEAYLKKYRKLYPILGLIGKPRSYDRFLANAEAILRFDAFDEIQRIACPTLIIGGEADKAVGVEGSRELQERIPNSALHIYPGLGHAAYEEAPDFNERVFQFLQE